LLCAWQHCCDEGIGCVSIKITVTSFILLFLDAAKLSGTICNSLFDLWEQAHYASDLVALRKP
jgi:hypothetical protein